MMNPRRPRREKIEAPKVLALVRDYIFANDGWEAEFYDWGIATNLGVLHISVHTGGTAIYCRFAEVDRAVAGMGQRYMNPYSGKWNHHPPASWTAKQIFEGWTRQMKHLLDGR